MYIMSFEQHTLISELKSRGYDINLIDEVIDLYHASRGIHSFFLFENLTVTSFDSRVGCVIATSKSSSFKFLKFNGYPHTNQLFLSHISQLDSAIKEIGYPCVIKPDSENKGVGVVSNINSKTDLLFYLNNNKSLYENGIILENHVPGDDYRITIIGGKFAFAIKRTPPCVIGDEVSSIKELIELKNKDLYSSYLKTQSQGLIEINDETIFNLKKKNYNLNTVLPKNEKLIIKDVSNLSQGGERNEIPKDHINEDVINMCENIAKKLKLFAVGIDYITKDITKSPEINKDAIIELNHSPEMDIKWFKIFVDRLEEFNVT